MDASQIALALTGALITLFQIECLEWVHLEWVSQIGGSQMGAVCGGCISKWFTEGECIAMYSILYCIACTVYCIYDLYVV